MHSREDVAIACLLCVAEEQHRATVIDFCLGKTNEPSLEEYMLSVGGQGLQGGGGAVHRDMGASGSSRRAYSMSTTESFEESKARLNRSETQFLARVFSAKPRLLVDIAKDVFNFFFVSQST